MERIIIQNNKSRTKKITLSIVGVFLICIGIIGAPMPIIPGIPIIIAGLIICSNNSKYLEKTIKNNRLTKYIQQNILPCLPKFSQNLIIGKGSLTPQTSPELAGNFSYKKTANNSDEELQSISTI